MATGNFCQTCGSQLDPKARFCTNCGSPVLTQPPYVADSPKTASPRTISVPPPQTSTMTTPQHSDRYSIIESKKKSPGVAAVLSFFWTGLGQIYVGEIGRGIGFTILAFFILLSVGIFIGIILVPVWWIYGIYDAYLLAHRHNQDMMKLI